MKDGKPFVLEIKITKTRQIRNNADTLQKQVEAFGIWFTRDKSSDKYSGRLQHLHAPIIIGSFKPQV